MISKGKCIVLNACTVKNRKISDQWSNYYLMKLEKEQQIKPKLSRKKKMINIIAAINGTDNRRTIEKIKETKSRLFKRMMKMITP